MRESGATVNNNAPSASTENHTGDDTGPRPSAWMLNTPTARRAGEKGFALGLRHLQLHGANPRCAECSDLIGFPGPVHGATGAPCDLHVVAVRSRLQCDCARETIQGTRGTVAGIEMTALFGRATGGGS